MKTTNAVAYSLYHPYTSFGTCEVVQPARSYASNVVIKTDSDKPSRRIKPDSLLSNPTARGPVATERRQTHVHLTTTPEQPFTCAGHPVHMQTVRQESISDAVNYPFTLKVPVPPPWETSIRNKIKALAVNSGETAFEYRETAGLAKSAAQAMASCWREGRRLLKGDTRLFKRVKIRMGGAFSKGDLNKMVGFLSSADLQYSFAVAPLMGYLNDAVDQLNRRSFRPTVIRVMAKVTATEGAHGRDDTVEGEGGYVRTQKAIVYVRLTPSWSDFTMGNPLSLGWELTPFSWIADQIFAVGDWLESLDALAGVEVIGGTLTTRDYIDKRKWSYYNKYTGTGGIKRVNSGLKDGFLVKETYTRAVITSIPLASRIPYVRSPSLNALRHAGEVLWNMRHS